MFDEAWGAAEIVGYTNAAPFYAPDAHVDTRAWNGFESTGLPAIIQNLRDNIQLPPVFRGRLRPDGRGRADRQPT